MPREVGRAHFTKRLPFGPAGTTSAESHLLIMKDVPSICSTVRETNNPPLSALAREHPWTPERMLVRPDGGTAHEGVFDPKTGTFLRQVTHQGLSADSDWSRGTAWSLSGFGSVSTDTDDPAVAERSTDHFIARCPENFVPPWDFDVPPGPDRIDDSKPLGVDESVMWGEPFVSEAVCKALGSR
jgi:unsaturated chondroitin disaccharide hydrolase